MYSLFVSSVQICEFGFRDCSLSPLPPSPCGHMATLLILLFSISSLTPRFLSNSGIQHVRQWCQAAFVVQFVAFCRYSDSWLESTLDVISAVFVQSVSGISSPSFEPSPLLLLSSIFLCLNLLSHTLLPHLPFLLLSQVRLYLNTILPLQPNLLPLLIPWLYLQLQLLLLISQLLLIPSIPQLLVLIPWTHLLMRLCSAASKTLLTPQIFE